MGLHPTTEDAARHESFWDWWDEASVRTEQIWFLEKFFPNYENLMALARDYLDETPVANFTDKGRHHGRSTTPTYSTAELCEKHNVSQSSLFRYIGKLVGHRDENGTRHGTSVTERNLWIDQIRRAAANYACWLARQHPLMPVWHIHQRVQEFVPDYSKNSVLRELHKEGLFESRAEVGRLLLSNGGKPIDPTTHEYLWIDDNDWGTLNE